MALVALGGPASNLLVALVLATGLRLAPALPYMGYYILLQFTVINLALTAFNLLPLPMLDGFHILMGAIASIRARWAYDLGDRLARLEPHGPMILLVLVMLGSFMRPAPLTRLVMPVFDLLVKVIGLG
jgi:Zn-dependent protease